MTEGEALGQVIQRKMFGLLLLIPSGRAALITCGKLLDQGESVEDIVFGIRRAADLQKADSRLADYFGLAIKHMARTGDRPVGTQED